MIFKNNTSHYCYYEVEYYIYYNKTQLWWTSIVFFYFRDLSNFEHQRTLIRLRERFPSQLSRCMTNMWIYYLIWYKHISTSGYCNRYIFYMTDIKTSIGLKHMKKKGVTFYRCYETGEIGVSYCVFLVFSSNFRCIPMIQNDYVCAISWLYLCHLLIEL